jgi:hypothetical protein
LPTSAEYLGVFSTCSNITGATKDQCNESANYFGGSPTGYMSSGRYVYETSYALMSSVSGGQPCHQWDYVCCTCPVNVGEGAVVRCLRNY